MNMSKRRTSILWKISKEDLQNLFNELGSISDILKALGLSAQAGNYKTIKRRIQEDDIDLTKFNENHKEHNKTRYRNLTIFNEIPIEIILIENSSYNCGKNLKKRLFKDGLLQEICSECGITAYWNNKPLSLQIDHINGIHTDNRIENLRILCPNCHSQTLTWGSKKLKKKHRCPLCDNPKSKESKLCSKCNSKRLLGQDTKIIWPSVDELIEKLKTHTFASLGRELGVTDNSIRKHLKRRGISSKEL